MTPYYHQINISTPPPTPREGNTFPPLKSHPPKYDHNHIHKREAFEEEGEEEEWRGPFDEDDIELQLSSTSIISNAEMGLKVLRFCSILFLGLVIIGTSIHITNSLYQNPTQLSQTCESVPPGVSCTDDRAPSEFRHEHDYSNKEPIRVPTYPSCDEAGCLIHQIPGQGAGPIGTATIFFSEPRFTIVNSPTPTPTSPPICVPPHFHPHSQGNDYANEESENDQSPPICVPPHCHPREPGETPPICVPPHCYPHPPPGHHHDHHHDHHHAHHHDHHRDKEGETIEDIPPPCFPPHCYPPHCYPPPIQANDESPPICVPPHCFPHPQDSGDDQLKEEEQQDNPRICSEDGCRPNTLPGRPVPECVAPYCYIRNPGHNDDEDNDSDSDEHGHGRDGESQNEVLQNHSHSHPIYNAPKACHPPHCYPPTPPSHANTEQIESPPICVPPHCYPHSTFEVDDDVRIYAEDQRLTIQTDQERQVEYLNAHPEIFTIQDFTPGSTQEEDDEEDDDNKPICMPPICVPPAKSAPIFVPCDGAEEGD